MAKSGKVISEKAIRFAGHPGRDYVIELQGPGGEALVTRSRCVLMSPETTFNLQVIRSKAAPVPNAREVAAFYGSLRLVDPAMAGPGRAAAAARARRIVWKNFNSAAGGFTILMPGDPTPSHEENGLLGAKGVDAFTGEHDQTLFVVQYQDLPRSALKKGTAAIMKAARSSDQKVVQGKVVGEKEATLKGAVGWSYQIESPDPDGLMARVRLLLVGPRLYQVIVAAPKTNFPADDSERFFRSFRLQSRN